jgi:hypothetical protein
MMIETEMMKYDHIKSIKLIPGVKMIEVMKFIKSFQSVEHM